MTAINVTSVSVLDNPSLFTNPLQFEIQYECLFDLKDGELAACSLLQSLWRVSSQGLGPQTPSLPPVAQILSGS